LHKAGLAEDVGTIGPERANKLKKKYQSSKKKL